MDCQTSITIYILRYILKKMHAEKQTFSDNRYFAFGSFYVQNPPMTHWINNLSSAVGHELLQKCIGNKIVVLGQ